jgi:hypothetical protein
VLWVWVYRVLALARGVALQPREGAAGVNVEEVGLRGLPDAHGNVEVAVLSGRKCVCQMPQFWKLMHTDCMYDKF